MYLLKRREKKATQVRILKKAANTLIWKETPKIDWVGKEPKKKKDGKRLRCGECYTTKVKHVYLYSNAQQLEKKMLGLEKDSKPITKCGRHSRRTGAHNSPREKKLAHRAQLLRMFNVEC